MPKDSAPSRSAILAAAVHTLKRGGIEGFTLDGVARRAGVVKGLVLYHYGSRGRLLRYLCRFLTMRPRLTTTGTVRRGPERSS